MLNNNGWGFRTFLICGAVLFLALIIATFFIIRLYSGLPELGDFMRNPLSYQDIEYNLNNKAIEYINNYYDEDITTGVIVVSTNNLIKYELITKTDLTDTNNNDLCSGYSLIRKENGNLTSESFIKCDNYITEGYQSWRVNNG